MTVVLTLPLCLILVSQLNINELLVKLKTENLCIITIHLVLFAINMKKSVKLTKPRKLFRLLTNYFMSTFHEK